MTVTQANLPFRLQGCSWYSNTDTQITFKTKIKIEDNTNLYKRHECNQVRQRVGFWIFTNGTRFVL